MTTGNIYYFYLRYFNNCTTECSPLNCCNSTRRWINGENELTSDMVSSTTVRKVGALLTVVIVLRGANELAPNNKYW